MLHIAEKSSYQSLHAINMIMVMVICYNINSRQVRPFSTEASAVMIGSLLLCQHMSLYQQALKIGFNQTVSLRPLLNR